MLIWAVTSVLDKWIAVIFVQNVLSLAASLCLVFSVRSVRRDLALPAALAMCGFLGSSQVLIYDVSLMSDSLYTSLVILTVAALVRAILARSNRAHAAASALMGCVILVRPAGSYFAVIYLVLVAFMLWNRAGRGALIGFAVPFPAILLSFCAYNKATIGEFVISPFAEANLAGATALFWEPDPSLPDAANKALEGLPQSYERNGITKEDLDLVRHSWDTSLLFDVYAKAYNRLVWSAGWGSGKGFGSGDYLKTRAYMRAVSILAIRKHPDLYAKYVWTNLVAFFGGIGYNFDFYASMAYRTRGQLPGEASAYMSNGAPGSPDSQKAHEVPFVERSLVGLQHAWQAFHGLVYQELFWTWIYLAISILTLVKLVQSRGHDSGCVLLFVISLIPLGASLVVCLVEVATDRYSYATQFVCYLMAALSPLLGSNPGSGGTPASARRA
jgi:hypothetical protein